MPLLQPGLPRASERASRRPRPPRSARPGSARRSPRARRPPGSPPPPPPPGWRRRRRGPAARAGGAHGSGRRSGSGLGLRSPRAGCARVPPLASVPGAPRPGAPCAQRAAGGWAGARGRSGGRGLIAGGRQRPPVRQPSASAARQQAGGQAHLSSPAASITWIPLRTFPAGARAGADAARRRGDPSPALAAGRSAVLKPQRRRAAHLEAGPTGSAAPHGHAPSAPCVSEAETTLPAAPHLWLFSCRLLIKLWAGVTIPEGCQRSRGDREINAGAAGSDSVGVDS